MNRPLRAVRSILVKFINAPETEVTPKSKENIVSLSDANARMTPYDCDKLSRGDRLTLSCNLQQPVFLECMQYKQGETYVFDHEKLSSVPRPPFRSRAGKPGSFFDRTPARHRLDHARLRSRQGRYRFLERGTA